MLRRMYALIRAYARSLARGYYQVAHRGAGVPDEGPLIVVANHTNGLIDAAVLSDVTPRQLHFIAKFSLFKMPVIGTIIRAAGAIRVFRKQDAKHGVSTEQNIEAFQAIYAALAEGRLISVFPEGSSHSRPRLQPLKTGTARMALGAEAELDFGLGVRVLPVGVVYEDRQRFRSRVLLRTGTPIAVSELQAQYASDPRAAVQRLTERIADGLEAVTLNLDDHAERPLLSLAERLHGASSPLQGIEPQRLQTLAEAIGWLRVHRPDRAQDLLERLQALRQWLHVHGLEPRDLDRERGLLRSLSFAARTLATLLAGGLALAAGALLWAPPLVVAWLIARLAPLGADKRVTVISLSTSVLAPLWALAATAAAGSAFGLFGAAAAALLLALLAVGAALAWQQRSQLIGALGVLLNLMPNKGLEGTLRGERDALAAEIATLHRMMRMRMHRRVLATS